MRPSTLLRISRLDALLAALAVRDLPQVEVASLLRCSASSARNYVLGLVDAGVILPVPHGHANGRMYKALYRLNPNQRTIASFRASLEQAGECAVARSAWPVRQHGPGFEPAGAVESPGCARPVIPPGGAVLRRDPLVSALFGE